MYFTLCLWSFHHRHFQQKTKTLGNIFWGHKWQNYWCGHLNITDVHKLIFLLSEIPIGWGAGLLPTSSNDAIAAVLTQRRSSLQSKTHCEMNFNNMNVRTAQRKESTTTFWGQVWSPQHMPMGNPTNAGRGRRCSSRMTVKTHRKEVLTNTCDVLQKKRCWWALCGKFTTGNVGKLVVFWRLPS